MSDVETEFHKAWLGMVQPIEGLVFSIPVLVERAAGYRLADGTQKQHRLRDLAPKGSIADLDALLSDVLGLTPDLFDRGAALPPDLHLWVPEGRQDIRPTLALRKQSASGGATASPGSLLPDDSTPESRAGEPYVALIWDLPAGLALDKPEAVTGSWDYPPAAKFDRLLRATRVPIGLLTNREVVRLVYAPHGEATGAITFRVDAMSEPGGRPILDAFASLLSANRLFAVSAESQLPALLAESRRRQANVTNALADQVLEALAVLLAGFEAAAERDGDDARQSLRDALEQDATGDHVYPIQSDVITRDLIGVAASCVRAAWGLARVARIPRCPSGRPSSAARTPAPRRAGRSSRQP